jgi:hypothetical protein
MNAPLLTRREAVARLALAMGVPLLGLDAFVRGAPPEGRGSDPAYSPEDLMLMDEVGDTIIPATDTPGAKATGIGAFMAMMVRDCCDDRQQAAFRAGLAAIDAAAKARFGTGFVAASPAQRTELLADLDRQARGPQAQDPAAHAGFRLIKQLTLVGYFTSEIGATKALRYVESPGSLDGNVPYKAGERAWFTPTSSEL